MLIYGLNYFIIRKHKSVQEAALLGFFTYAVYELTNLSLFKIDDDITFLKSEWDLLYYNQAIKTGYHHLIFCEHPHVYTLGKSGDLKNLLIDGPKRKEKNISFYKINRGGDITYHGPGQLVVYPILDLDYFFSDIHKYLRYLEDSVILTLSQYGLKGKRIEGLTGVWVEDQNGIDKKICAIGVKSSRWVTMHGIGFNINSDLSYFNNIIPCGINDKSVTSLKQELGIKIDMNELKNRFKSNFINIFKCLV